VRTGRGWSKIQTMNNETIEQIVVPLQLVEPLHKNTNIIMTHEAERFNGWAAMLGFVAAIGAYATTGQIIPGIF